MTAVDVPSGGERRVDVQQRGSRPSPLDAGLHLEESRGLRSGNGRGRRGEQRAAQAASAAGPGRTSRSFMAWKAGC